MRIGVGTVARGRGSISQTHTVRHWCLFKKRLIIVLSEEMDWLMIEVCVSGDLNFGGEITACAYQAARERILSEWNELPVSVILEA